MSIIKCTRCNHETNTSCSNHIDANDGVAQGCYARIRQVKTKKGLTWAGKLIVKEIEKERSEQGTAWEKGCLYKRASKFDQQFADAIIKRRW